MKGETVMKKYLICTLFVLILFTGCQSSTENKQGETSSAIEPESTITGEIPTESPTEAPKLSDSIQIVDQEYDVYKSGKEIKNYDDDTSIYFSNESLLCYSKNDQERIEDESFFLYDRKTKQKHRIITVKNIDSCCGDMYEKDECLYLAIGVMENEKEQSYILKIDEKTFDGELIKIKGCNTIFSSVVCSDNTLFVWYMKEQKDSKEYCLGYLKKRKINPVHSWIKKEGKNDVGQEMSTLATNGDELFCYVEDKEEKAYIEVYNGKGKVTKNILIDFSDFQNTSEGKDVFWKMFCFQNLLVFETLNHRILVAKYDGKNITRIKDGNFMDLLAGNPNDEDGMEVGSCIGIASFSDKMILCGNLDNRNELLIWEIDNETIKNIFFKSEDAEILSYQMLTENEVVLKLVDDNEESRRFYCKIE